MRHIFLVLSVCISCLVGAWAEEGDLPKVEAAVLGLQERSGWEPALEQLLAVPDDRIRFVLQHIEERSLAVFEGRPVYVVESPSEESPASIYPVWSDGAALPEAIATVTAVDRYREQRKARKAALKALTVIGLRAQDANVRQEAAEDLANKQEVDAFPFLQELAQGDPVPAVRRAAAVAAATMTIDANTGSEVSNDELVAAAATVAE